MNASRLGGVIQSYTWEIFKQHMRKKTHETISETYENIRNVLLLVDLLQSGWRPHSQLLRFSEARLQLQVARLQVARLELARLQRVLGRHVEDARTCGC